MSELKKVYIFAICFGITSIIVVTLLFMVLMVNADLKAESVIIEAELVTVEEDLSDTLTKNYYLKAHVERLERIVSDVFNTEFTKEMTVYSKIVTATAYTAREEECNDEPEKTSSGRPSRVGGIGVSRDLEALGINIGDLVVIKEMGLFRVEDRTATYKRKNTDNPVPITNTVDILHANLEAARIFGTGPVEIIWLGEAS